MIPRRSAATPVITTRTTPDSKRKGSSSASGTGHGLGIRTGYSLDGRDNNVGGSTSGLASTPLKPAAAASSSRLPTLKASTYATGQGQMRIAGDVGVVGINAGNDMSALAATNDSADVPPVPAIPRVYGSPHTSTFDHRAQSSVASTIAGASTINGAPPVPSARKASLPAETHLGEVAAGESTWDYATSISNEKQRRNHQHHHGQRAFSLYGDCKRVTLTSPQRANQNTRLQPLKLPPLNIAPLSGSITRHIDALKPAAVRDVTNAAADNLAAERMPVTTPPPRAYPRTPATPMTASKATFFANNKDVESKVPHSVKQKRRTTSSAHFGALSDRRLSPGSAGSEDHIVEMADDDTIKPSTAIVGQTDMSDIDPDVSDIQGLPESPATVSASEEKGLPTPTPTSSASSLPRSLGNGFPRMSSGSHESSHRNVTAEEKDKVATGFGGTTAITEIVAAKVSNYEFDPTSSTSKVVPSATLNSTGSTKAFPTELKGSPAVAKQRTTSLHIKGRSAGAALLANGATSSGASLRAPSMGIPPPSAHTNDSPVETHRAPPPRAALTASQGRTPAAGFRSFSSGKIRVADHALDRYDLAADEEMRRLGSKRKDLEIQARVLDDLGCRACPKDRASAPLAIRFANLNIFERGEIVDFKEIYFTGTPHAKKIAGDLHSSAANFGYDDERGDYNVVIGDHLAFRYEVVDVLGRGSFGQVVRCIDHKIGGLVAVKIIRNKKRFHQQALVEVNLLAKLKEWDPNRRHGVVNFTQSFYWRGHLCISTELLGMNLYELIKAHDFKGFSLRIIRRFTSQILSTLLLLRQHKVIHCDLKPENILLAHPLKSEIKVIDFGSSCFENEKVYTYIQSRFYRSPEVILGMSYGMPIDMWSLGCIMAELYTGYPIFPGENEQEQLACIMEIFGPPERHLIEKSSRRKLFFDSNGRPRATVSSKGRRRRPSSKDLKHVLKCDDDAFLDFIARCLRWNPNSRLNPADALNHEFITGVKAPPRPRHYGSSSSVRRALNMRPLPTPPGDTVSGALKTSTSVLSSTAVRSPANRPTLISSPSKVSPATRSNTRRQYNIGGNRNSSSATTGPSRRRLTTHASSSGLTGSSLTRVSQRSVSTKAGLPTAAATTSLAS
ncbi:hypothetical protein KEM55_004849 [Ascosphaera atra]|nr:hypothetical protein KEM55_004849 [Ascosphaera atra]